MDTKDNHDKVDGALDEGLDHSKIDLTEEGPQETGSVPDLPNNESESVESPTKKSKPLSVLKVIGIAVLVAILVISLLLNISLLSIGLGDIETSFPFHWVLIIGSLLITSVSLAISFWLYYVRTIYLKDGPALVPEKWGVLISELAHITNQSNLTTIKALTSLTEESSAQSDKSESLLESFLTLQETISNRDEEIARLKKGHDSKVFKRFITRFIRVSVSLEEIREEAIDTDQAKNYKYLCKKIRNALEECGVEQLFPEVGHDYRQMGSEVDDDPKVIDTNDESKNFQVVSVESPAYVFEGEGDREIIIPSKVTIYRIQQEGVTENV